MAPKKKPVKQPRRKPGTGSIRFKRGRALPFEAAFTHADNTTQYDSFATAEEAAAHLDGLSRRATIAKRRAILPRAPDRHAVSYGVAEYQGRARERKDVP
jgi:hypothetical protein